MFSLPLGHAYAQPLLPCSQAGPPAHVARAPLPSICLPPVPRTRNMKAAGLANEGVSPGMMCCCKLLRPTTSLVYKIF